MSTSRRLTSDQAHHRRVGTRWGSLLHGINIARQSMLVAYGARDLLPKELRDELTDLHHRLAGLEAACWNHEAKEVEGKP